MSDNYPQESKLCHTKKVFAMALDTLRKQFYSKNVRNTAERIELPSHLRHTYFIAYGWSMGNTIDLTIEGANAKFHILNYKQWKVMDRLRGSEWGVAQKLLSELKHDDVFWDVGANIGQYSCLAFNLIDEGEVIAVEPYPTNVKILERNIQLNKANIDVKLVALSGSECETTFYLVDTTEAGASQGSINREYAKIDDAPTAVTVETTSGDRLVQADNVPIPDEVKMDIEGAAPEAIQGMADILESNVRFIIVGTHDNSQEVKDLLGDLGFRVEYDKNGDSLPMVFG